MSGWMLRVAPVLVAFALFGCPPPRSGGGGGARCPKEPLRHCLPPRQQVVDLTHVLHSDIPILPGDVPFTMSRLVDHDQGYRLHKLEMGENVGTHVDAPLYLLAGGRGIERLTASDLVVPAVVIDMRKEVEQSADYQLSANDIIDWEGANGPVPVGSLVILNSGWHTRFDKPKEYLNQDAEGVMHFPGFGRDAVQLLLERDVVGIGIDTLSVDPGASQDFAAHKVMLAAGKYQIENLANLDALPAVGATVIVGVLPIADGTEAPARVIALVPEKLPDEDEDDEGEEAP